MLEDTLIELINQLKIIAPEVWRILIKQVYLEALDMFFWFSVLAMASYFLYKFVRNKKVVEEDDDYNWLYVLVGFLSIVAVAFLVGSIKWVVNPEFYAIRFLLERLTP